MTTWVSVALVVLVGIFLARGLARATELFAIDVRSGRMTLVRGRLPSALADDLADIFSRARLERATMRVVMDGGRPTVVFRGEVDDGCAQRIRNAVGRFRVPEIRNGNRRP